MKIVLQDGNSDCGAASLLSIIKYYGGNISIEKLRELTNTTKDGVTAYNLIEASKSLGFDSIGVNGSIDEIDISKLPIIAHVHIRKGINHFIVIYNIDHTKDKITIMDPSIGKRIISFSEFYLMTTNNYIYLTPIKKIANYKYYKFINTSIIKYIIKNKKYSIIISLLTILYFIINILVAFHFKYLINYSINYNITTNIKIISLLILFLYLLKSYNFIIRNFILLKWLSNFDLYLTNKVYKQIIFLPYSYYKNRTVGEVINRIKDLNIIKEFISNILVYFISDFISIIIFLILMFSINKNLSIFVIIYFIFTIIIFITSKNNIEKKLNILKKNNDYTNTLLVETINNIDTIKNTHIEKRFIDTFILKYKKLLNNSYKYTSINYYMNSIKEVLNNLLLITIYGLGSYLVIKGKITILELFLFEMFFNYFNTSINRIMNILDTYNDYKLSVKRIDDLFNIEKESFKDSYYYLNYKLDKNIIFNNLTYKINNKVLLNNINLKILKGEKVLLFGNSGSGKSTLVKILMRYIEIPYNMVSINDIDINHYHLESIRSNITYISSNEYLFNDTIYNNICMNKEINKDEFYEVINNCLVNDICNCNYDKVIESGGFNLSNGERQRIILARSLIRKSNIYIFDEAFNGIDIERERKIMSNIFSYLKDKTIIVISHRFNNKDLFDKVYELKEGNIYEV